RSGRHRRQLAVWKQMATLSKTRMYPRTVGSGLRCSLLPAWHPQLRQNRLQRDLLAQLRIDGTAGNGKRSNGRDSDCAKELLNTAGSSRFLSGAVTPFAG